MFLKDDQKDAYIAWVNFRLSNMPGKPGHVAPHIRRHDWVYYFGMPFWSTYLDVSDDMFDGLVQFMTAQDLIAVPESAYTTFKLR